MRSNSRSGTAGLGLPGDSQGSELGLTFSIFTILHVTCDEELNVTCDDAAQRGRENQRKSILWAKNLQT